MPVKKFTLPGRGLEIGSVPSHPVSYNSRKMPSLDAFLHRLQLTYSWNMKLCFDNL